MISGQTGQQVRSLLEYPHHQGTAKAREVTRAEALVSQGAGQSVGNMPPSRLKLQLRESVECDRAGFFRGPAVLMWHLGTSSNAE